MKNKRLIYFFAITLSIIFSLLYLLIFKYYIPSQAEQKATTLYVHQIGLFKEVANAEKTLAQLKSKQIIGYIYKQKDIYVVVCGVSEDQSESKKMEAKLKETSFSYITKTIEVKDAKMNELITQKQYQEVLELIGNQS